MSGGSALEQRQTWLQRLSEPWPLALAVTLVGTAVAYVGRPTDGIDDAEITHVFAHNIAAGFGYVYNPGGERVEGSTSLLWTLLNVIPFSVSDHPEGFLALLCFALL